MRKSLTIAHIVPTGVQAGVGGYIADATPATNLLASVADVVISNPNVVNGSLLNMAADNVWYTEGLFLDKFFENKIVLRPTFSQRIGVIIERKDGQNKIGTDLSLNAIESMRTISGANIIGYRFTKGEIKKKVAKTPTGAYVGEVENPDIFLDEAYELIKAGATAIAITTEIVVPQDDLAKYFQGQAPNPYGGLEAVISHSIGQLFGVPAAHAPMLTKEEMDAFLNQFGSKADPRAAGELASQAYLGCVLKGLQRAPNPIPIEQAKPTDLTINDFDAVVLPHGVLGGIPALVAAKRNIPVIEVKENSTLHFMTNEVTNFKNVITVDNYLEAIGILSAIKAGIDWQAVRRPISRAKELA